MDSHHYSSFLALPRPKPSPQQRTYYDASGKSLGRSTTDSQGTVTNTDSRSKVISRETAALHY